MIQRRPLSSSPLLIVGGALALLLSLGGTASASGDRSPYRSLTPWVHDLIRIDHGFTPELDWSSPDAPDPDQLRESALRRPTYDAEAIIETTHFLIHYNEGDDNQLEKATALAEFAEEVWDVETGPRIVGGFGWPVPPPDAGRGGDDRYDVYVDDLIPGLYGVTYADTSTGDYQFSSYIIVGSWMSVELLSVTIAHEFLHGIQWGWDALEDAWFFESPAIWIEDEVYDDVNDYVYFVIDAWRKPELPLDNPSMAYPHGLFIKYVTEQVGTDVVRQAWEIAAETPNAISVRATRDAVSNVGSWPDIMHGYHRALVDVTLFQEADLYTEFTLGTAGAISAYPGEFTGEVDYTAGNMIDLEVLSSSPGTLTLTVSASGLKASLMVAERGVWTTIPLELDGSGASSVVLEEFGSRYGEGIVVFTNPDIQGSLPYSLTADVTGWENGCTERQGNIPFTRSWALPLLFSFGLLGAGRKLRRRNR